MRVAKLTDEEHLELLLMLCRYKVELARELRRTGKHALPDGMQAALRTEIDTARRLYDSAKRAEVLS